MDEKQLLKILRAYKKGEVGEGAVLAFLKQAPFTELSGIKIDHHRKLRTGFPEVIFGQGKSVSQLQEICTHLVLANRPLIITRLEPEIGVFLADLFPEKIFYLDMARIALGQAEYATYKKFSTEVEEDSESVSDDDNSSTGRILLIAAGSSDIPVAEEAATILAVAGKRFRRIYDVGVAGLHRLIDVLPELQRADILLVFAGMEGALPSVIAGLVSSPVIGVPTSIGYGTGLNGITPLFAMLNSCAPGVSVVNIDNGFGAAMMAIAIDSLKEKEGYGNGPAGQWENQEWLD